MLLNTQPIKAFSNLYNQELSFDSILKQDEEGRPYHAILHNSLKEYMLSLAKNLANDQKSPPVIIDYKPIETSMSHSVVDCTIKMGNYQITETGEATIATLNSSVAKNFPYLEAQTRAYDRAVISFLQLQVDGKRVYSDRESA
ncbi:hypothetical protein bpr_II255 (plasmid) [Butyrivibrio proteoclasticus B316]|uniref:Uncharacterized protein n=1 Tax=Butyrivibrio proteoclasticus (strain ATCC 51982 / DSM 14932 / B316) TaxID=515622 RepID=E0S460_BUTPB|nr:hypothetical protein [Butyrivibrio proteoclasticus]ADL36192.1 hypothetical protein bpr_II255 [Butyrivibrio proteoclasticus B316]